INPLRSASCEYILQPNWLLVAIGFASLLFNLQWVFDDLSVVSRWASNAFPNQPLDPIPNWSSHMVWFIFWYCNNQSS
ncbi:unnamed protein product, partial [Rotaria sordida]